MLLYRSLVLGLIGALIMLEVARTGPAHPGMRWATAERAAAAPTIVDVSRHALDAGADVAPLLGLHPGERVAAIDDARVVDAGAALAAIRAARGGEYIDLDVARAGGARRVLVLVH
jgi:hypothetical protein